MAVARTQRRTFLKVTLTAGGALVVGIPLGCRNVPRRPDMWDVAAATGALEPNAWIRITPSNEFIFQLGHAEMGQGVMTSLATLVAEELSVDPARLTIELAAADPRYGGPTGMMITGGSMSVSGSWTPLREAGATARILLAQAAAQDWQVPVGELLLEDGVVRHPQRGRRAPYGAFTVTAAQLPLPTPVLKPREEHRFIGRPVPRVDARQKVDGTAVFGLDVDVPGMLFAAVVRSPRQRAQLSSFDGAAAKASSGVRAVFAIPTGVAVVAESTWQAFRGAALVVAEWEDTGEPFDTDAHRERCQKTIEEEEEGNAVLDVGDLEAGFANAARSFEAVYETPFLEHAPMEPMNCTASVTQDAVTIWAPTQSPTMAFEVARSITGFPAERCACYPTLLGGGFGRRGGSDFVAEATHISMHLRRPVKLTWTREDCQANGFYRPHAYAKIRAALDDKGTPLAVEHRQISQSILATFGRDMIGAVVPDWVPEKVSKLMAHGVRALFERNYLADPVSLEGAVDLPYALGAERLIFINDAVGPPVGFWRSVGFSENGFITESFIDELAHLATEDPLAFRRRLLDPDGPHRRVLDLVESASGWSEPVPAGRGRGVALVYSFGTYVAQVAEVSVDEGRVRVHRVTCAVDCGTVVNPDIARAQFTGAVVFGLSAALRQQISFTEGVVRETNFHLYDSVRMDDMPVVDVHFVDSDAPPTGAGEPGLPPIAPAVANAVYMATGHRVRRLPIEAELAALGAERAKSAQDERSPSGASAS